jgi:prohibitin 1
MVNITLRVLSKPDVEQLPRIFRNLGLDWDERVLPSIGNEVLKAVVAQYQAEQLLTQVGGGWREAGCCAAASRGVALHSGGKGGEGMEVHRTPYLPASLAT